MPLSTKVRSTTSSVATDPNNRTNVHRRLPPLAFQTIPSQMYQRRQREATLYNDHIPNPNNQSVFETDGPKSRVSTTASKALPGESILTPHVGTIPSSKNYMVPGGELTLRVTTLSPYAYSIYTNSLTNTSSPNPPEVVLNGGNSKGLLSSSRGSKVEIFEVPGTGRPTPTAPTATSGLKPRKTSSRLRHQQLVQQQQLQQRNLLQNNQSSSVVKKNRNRSPAVSSNQQVSSHDLNPDLVKQYLYQNPDVLDQFVSSDLVPENRLREWLQKKDLDQGHSQDPTHTGHIGYSGHGGDSSITNAAQRPALLPSLREGNFRDAHLLSTGHTPGENGDHGSVSSLVLSHWKSKIQTSKRKVLHELSKEMHHASGKYRVLVELADCVASAVSADSYTLYSCDPSSQELTHLSRGSSDDIVHGAKEKIGPDTSVAASVAYLKEPIRLRDLLEIRSNDGLKVSDERASTVLALPVLDNQNTCFGVVELHRHSMNSYFVDEEEEVGLLMLQWYDMLVDYVETHSTMMRQRTLSDFLLEVTKSIFQDIVSMDVVIMKIMNFAKALVQADRTALFLLDTRSNELYARIFDDGYSLEEFASPMEAKVRAMDHTDSKEKKLTTASHNDSRNPSTSEAPLSDEVFDASGDQDRTKAEMSRGLSLDDKKDKRLRAEWYSDDIRFSMEKGVAGFVASTGKILNIADAYKDKRFNPEVDIRTGYRTKSILCMPIFIRGNVIGVVQMVNKLNGTFTKEDEESFATFAIYCGLALHHAKLYEKIRRSEQKYKVALDVLSYHSQALPEEVAAMRARPIPNTIKDITAYHFSPWSVGENDKPLYCLFMFRALFSNIKYDLDDLIRFTLTVRKNYRNVPYHNWAHAFSVAHSMFVVITSAKHKLTPLESISLFVACLCHDLDHRGKTNQFMVQSESPLAAIYSTSTMEHHHFNQTVTILQNEGHNIFKYLSSDDYKQVLGEIKQSILATDLAVFFRNRAELNTILSTEEFDWNTVHHKNVLTAVTMTACDLCAMFKPWDVQQRLVYIIMEEFWQQGDEEKKRGIKPVEMMDRNKRDDLPQLEVGFIQSICVPCYELMYRVMPDTKPMLEGAKANLERWKKLVRDQETGAGTAVDKKASALSPEGRPSSPKH